MARVLGHYSRQQELFPVETAVQKMSSLTAEHLGIPLRGRIEEGYFADLVLFDPRTVIDRATAEEPHLTSTGIDLVWVNGELVYADGAVTGALPGRVIRKQ